MSVRSVKIILKSGKIVPCKTTQQIEHIQDVEKLGDNKEPVVFLFTDEQLSILRQHVDIIVDREKKDPRKGLAEYLLQSPQGKIPLINGNYTSGGKLLAGVRSLLQSAHNKKMNVTCIIGAAKKVFDDVWSSAEEDEDILPYRSEPLAPKTTVVMLRD